jgi:hypothetical protein
VREVASEDREAGNPVRKGLLCVCRLAARNHLSKQPVCSLATEGRTGPGAGEPKTGVSDAPQRVPGSPRPFATNVAEASQFPDDRPCARRGHLEHYSEAVSVP